MFDFRTHFNFVPNSLMKILHTSGAENFLKIPNLPKLSREESSSKKYEKRIYMMNVKTFPFREDSWKRLLA